MVRNHAGWLMSDYIAANAANRGETAAVVFGEASLSWKEFDERTRAVAAALDAAGARPGDRVATVMSNGIAALEVMIGTIRAGMVTVPLNTTLTDGTIAGLVADAGASVLVATSDHADRFSGISASVIRILDGGARPGWLDYRAWCDAAPSPAPAPVDPDAVCTIIYSSGTTGVPKGIMHTQKGRIDWAYDLAVALRYGEAARCLIVTGLYSNISWVGILCTILVGGTLVIHERFDPAATLREIAAGGITNISMVPLQYQRVIENPLFPATDTRSMRAMMCCGSPLPVGLKQRLLAEFACGVIDLYGLTEGVATVLPPEAATGRLESVGRAIPGNQVQLLDEAGRFAAPGEAGEIIGLSRFATSGYWNNPAATEAALWVDSAGRRWLRTGDIGRFDAEGYLYVVDRKKDMILSGGQNIYPADLEAVLNAHAAVAECAVIGTPHPEWDESPLALVVARADTPVEPEALRTWANERLGRQQRIARLELVAELPRNANGKILKNELRAAYSRIPDAPLESTQP